MGFNQTYGFKVFLQDPNDFWSYGESLENFGLCVGRDFNPYGILTRGFIWQAHDTWFDVDANAGVSTSWGPALGYSGNATMVITATAWTPALGYSGNATMVITGTTWVPSQFGLYGEVPP